MSQWKQGDTRPDMVIDCYDADGRKADLSGTSTLKVVVTQRGSLVWERPITDVSDGTVTIPLQPADTATPGTYFVKVFAQWPDGTRQHYPPADEYMHMTVTR